MAASDYLYPRFPLGGSEIPVKNTTGSGTAIAFAACVKIDSTNVVSGTQPQIGVVACTAVTDFPFGLMIEKVADAAFGRCQIAGIAEGLGVAAGVSAGALVGASGSVAGCVVAATTSDPALGQALTAGVSALDPVLIRIAPYGYAK